ncbi:hypothetical protein JDV09_25995 [Mycobacterium sp. Y57]|nr:hypothetical protein [Mycolicibacterium xanthum]
MITLTVNEFRRLFDAILLSANHTITTLLAWSRWRRRHQYRARQSHYRARQSHYRLLTVARDDDHWVVVRH